MQDRGHYLTEQRNPRSARIDHASIDDAFDIINAEDALIPAAVAAAKSEIVRAVELVANAFAKSGRLFYVGAGTSGRLGVLDASECPPTFLSDPDRVQGIIAGGWDALRTSIEGAEDSPDAGAAAIDERGVSPADVVMGIATGGSTPFVHGALGRARLRGAKTIFFACVPRDVSPDDADVSIRVLVGPEVITGSTRMKAGTATKLVLNMISTISMVRIGKVYENLMVDVNTRANKKLVDRGTRIVQTIAKIPRAEAAKFLDAAEGRVKTALVMHARGVRKDEAERLLASVAGHLSRLLRGE